MARPDGPAPITPIVLISMVAIENPGGLFAVTTGVARRLFYTDARLQAPLQAAVA
jgi:hypothetical protein